MSDPLPLITKAHHVHGSVRDIVQETGRLIVGAAEHPGNSISGNRADNDLCLELLAILQGQQVTALFLLDARYTVAELDLTL